MERFTRTIFTEYIPELDALNLCRDVLFSRVLVQEESGVSFSLQLVFGSEADYRFYIDRHLKKAMEALQRSLGECFLYFSTTLQEVAHE